MALTLILMRHAKSSWDSGASDDFDRPLNGRGRSSAKKLGAWLATSGYVPETVLLSGARRTVETWERIATALPPVAQVEHEPALYLSSSDVMMRVLKAQSSTSLMVIAHNPGIADFAARLADAPPAHEKFAKYPTGATTVLRFDAPKWSEFDLGTGRVIDFAVPREL